MVKFFAALWRWLAGLVRGRPTFAADAQSLTGHPPFPVSTDSKVDDGLGVPVPKSSVRRPAPSATPADPVITRSASNPQRVTPEPSAMAEGIAQTTNKAPPTPATANSRAHVDAPPTITSPKQASNADLWPQDSAALPWYDQLDWTDRIEHLRHQQQLSTSDEVLLRKWCEEGCVVVPGLVAAELIDAMVAEIDAMWERGESIEGLAFSGLEFEDGHHVHVPHSELVRIHLAQRRRIKEISNWRIGQYHLYAPSARQIFDHPGIDRIASTIFARRGEARYSSLYCKGTEVALRQDTCFFHIFPRNFMMGIWVACEDIKAGSGPLEYYPRSHRAPLFAEFTNYPQTNRRTSDPAQRKRYDAHIANAATSYQRQELLVGKGDVMFWHPMLIYGGSPRLDPHATRKSFVIHNIAEDADVTAKITGTISW